MTHTPTPWNDDGIGIDGADRFCVTEFDQAENPVDAENRPRIVACVNFFHGRDIPTENIPESGFWVMADALDKARKAFIRIQNEGDAHSNAIATKCLNRIEP